MTSERPFRHALPSYPRVVVNDGAIVIIYENEEREVWDYEANRAVAETVAEDIEVGLRSIYYVRSLLLEFLDDVADELLALNVPMYLLEDAIEDAFTDVYRKLPEITKGFSQKAEKR